MADRAVWQRTIVDERGNIIPGAEVTVRSYPGGSLVTLYESPGGAPKSNPFVTGHDGFARFWADSQRVEIVAVGAGSSIRWIVDLLNADEVIGDAVSEATAAAAVAVGEAEAAADRAEAARDAAQLNAHIYDDTDAGLAATTDGDYFSVPSEDDDEYLILYRNDNGSATEIRRYPSIKRLEPLRLSTATALTDEHGAVGAEYEPDTNSLYLNGMRVKPSINEYGARMTDEFGGVGVEYNPDTDSLYLNGMRVKPSTHEYGMQLADEFGGVGVEYNPDTDSLYLNGMNVRPTFDLAGLRLTDAFGVQMLGLDGDSGVGLFDSWVQPINDGIFRILKGSAVVFEIDMDGRVSVGSTDSAADPIVEAAKIWVGAPSDTSFTVRCDLDNGVPESVRLAVSTSEDDFSNPVYRSEPVTVDSHSASSAAFYYSAQFTVEGLDPATDYYGRFEVDGNPQSSSVFHVRTLPAAGTPAAYVALGFSCNYFTTDDETAPAFEAMAKEDADFSVHTGDLYYGDIAVDDVRRQRRWYRRILGNQSVARFLKSTSMLYIPSDHDMGPNNIHRGSNYNGTTALTLFNNSQRVYSEVVPHWPFVHPGASFPGPDTVLTQAQTIGNIHHILLDMRSQRQRADQEGDPSAVLGNGVTPPGSWDQVGWLKSELLAAGSAGRDAVVLWMPEMIHISVDGWHVVAPQEWEDLAAYIRDTPGIPQVYCICGDVHWMAFDDGSRLRIWTSMTGVAIPQFVLSGVHRVAGGQNVWMSWNGSITRIVADNNYGRLEFAADGHLTCHAKGAPYIDGVPTTHGVFSTDDAVPEITFNGDQTDAPASSTFNVPVTKTWFGPPGAVDEHGAIGSVDWSTDDSQSGVLRLRPNCQTYTIPVEVPATGSVVVTISNPSSGLVLGDHTSFTINAI